MSNQDDRRGEREHRLTERELVDLVATHFQVPEGTRWFLRVDTGPIAVTLVQYDPHKHRHLRNAPPLMRLVPTPIGREDG